MEALSAGTGFFLEAAEPGAFQGGPIGLSAASMAVAKTKAVTKVAGK